MHESPDGGRRGIEFPGFHRTREPRLSWGLLLLLAAALLIASSPARAQTETPFFNLPLFTWPLPDSVREVTSYPDTAWSWAFLGLVPGMACPGFDERDPGPSAPYWRDPDLPEDQDWLQASLGHRKLACYRGHAGTDIYALPGTPVYAVADGVVVSAESGSAEEGVPGIENGLVVIAHQREYRGEVYTWTTRYLHLRNALAATLGPVREGQLVGYVADQGTNSHLHIEFKDLFDDCTDRCIVNPWGPDVLWIDYDDKGGIDPATDSLPPVPPSLNLVRDARFADDLAEWVVSPGMQWRAQNGILFFARAAGSTSLASIKQVLPYAVEAGTPLEVRFNLGNNGPAPKFVGVSVREPDRWIGGVGCVFALPPYAPLQPYRMRGQAGGAWANLLLHFSVTPADGVPEALLDDLHVEALPGAAVAPSTECIAPGP